MARPPSFVHGFEVAGIVDAVGAGVKQFTAGDRFVSYVAGGTGGYAEYTIVHPGHAFRVPDGLSLNEAVASRFSTSPPTIASSSGAGSNLVSAF